MVFAVPRAYLLVWLLVCHAHSLAQERRLGYSNPVEFQTAQELIFSVQKRDGFPPKGFGMTVLRQTRW